MPVECYVDGASRGQGVVPGVDGEAAVGVVVYRNNQLIGKYARGIGKATNNHAELEAVLTCLMMCWGNPNLEDPIIYTDSQVTAKLVNGEWYCRNDSLRPLVLSIQEIQEVFRFRLIQVPRGEVAEADSLAKKFLDKLQERLVEDKKRQRRIRKKKIQPTGKL